MTNILSYQSLNSKEQTKKFEKLCKISPYNYCACNSISYVDFDGNEWDWSGITKNQRQVIEKNLILLAENNPLFKEMYTVLSNSENKYKLSIGKTEKNLPGQFVINEKFGGGTIVFRDIKQSVNSYTIFEEVFHAYQQENKSLYRKDRPFNREFEAKIAVTLIGSPGGGIGEIPGAVEMQKFIQSEYDFQTPTFKDVMSKKFLIKYLQEAANFGQYYEKYLDSDTHYKEKTVQSPKSIERLIKDSERNNK